jgi:8-oxo-dGTP diphosphatase
MTTTKKTRAQWIPVVAGVVHRRREVLVGQRPEGPLRGVWEFPGGKIETGETPEQALRRELTEELGIDAEIGPLILATTHNYSEVGILLLFYDVKFWKGSPTAAHHLKLQWVPIDDLKTIDLPEANRKVLDRLMQHLRETSR